MLKFERHLSIINLDIRDVDVDIKDANVGIRNEYFDLVTISLQRSTRWILRPQQPECTF